MPNEAQPAAIATAPDPTEPTRLLAERLRLFCRQQRKTVIPVVAACTYLVLLCQPHVSGGGLYAWATFVVGLRVAVFFLCTRLLRSGATDGRERSAAALFVVLGFVSGVAGGAIAPLYFHSLPVETQAIATMVIVAWVVGGLVTNAALPRAYVAFMFPFIAEITAHWLLSPRPDALGVAALLGILVILMLVTLAENGRAVVESIRIRFENEALVAQLRRANEEAERARQAAETANVAKSKFLAAASHDLRQPLHALSLLTGLLLEPEAKASPEAVALQLDRSVRSMDLLFEALLDLSKLDAGAITPVFRSVDLRRALEPLAAEYRRKASLKNLQVDCVLPQLAVRTDPILLERMIRNLLDNAVKYTACGSIDLTARRAEGNAVVVEVADTGPGIPPEEQERVFEEFYQVGNRERSRAQGLGLGLAIVKRLSALLDARLTMRSTLGQGTTFSVVIPLAAEETAALVEDAAARTADASGSLHGAVVVAIDDDLEVQDALRLLLQQWEAKAIVVGSLRAAEAALDALRAQPACAICDYRLGGDSNGIDAIRALRARFARLPALLISGDISVRDLEEIKASGIELMHKPVAAAGLKSWIAAAIAQGRMHIAA